MPEVVNKVEGLRFLNESALKHRGSQSSVAREATADGVDKVAADPRLQACVDIDQGVETTALPPIAVSMIELLGTAAVLEDVKSLPGRSIDDFEVGKALYEERARERQE